MAQRISRAKQSIKASGVPFQMPTAEETARRLGAVLHVLYLIFNEGYTTSSGPRAAPHRPVERGDPPDAHAPRLAARRRRGRGAARADAADRRAARRAHRPGGRADPARPSRIGACGISARSPKGVALVDRARCRGARSAPYQLQAAIAAVHDEAAQRRGDGLAADPGALRPARAHVRQPDGDAQPRDRDGDGARPGGGARAAEGARRATRACRATIASTRCARICWSGRAIARPRSRTTGARPSARRASPERNYLLTQAARLGIEKGANGSD